MEEELNKEINEYQSADRQKRILSYIGKKINKFRYVREMQLGIGV